VGEPAAEAGLQQRDGHAAGHLAAVVAAHAVGQQHQTQRGVEGDRVLVVGAHPAGVGERGEIPGERAGVGGNGCAEVRHESMSLEISGPRSLHSRDSRSLLPDEADPETGSLQIFHVSFPLLY
jgi:hypothetical protein